MNSYSNMIGKTMISVVDNGDELTFNDDVGNVFRFYHAQDCCECVQIDDISGDLEDLKGSPILVAEETDSDFEAPESTESYTWTEFRFETSKGKVLVRWLGQSNGYYPEGVSYEEKLK